jgi:hydrogenase-4 component F
VWLKAAFVLFLVGYGTKMGLVPLHTWLPDAHSEAPSPVSALLSGALLNCAFLAILRLHSILVAAGLGGFSGAMLVGFGILSVVAAAAFLVRQADYKRMLAYSSVENMGLLALGAGLGGAGGFAALLHAGNHTMAKGMLFLAAGNILMGTRTKVVAQATGLRERMPATAALWIAGLLAITGMPPAGVFVSKLLIARRAFEAGRFWIAGLMLFALAMAFAGMTAVALRMVYGKAAAGQAVAPPAHAAAAEAAAPSHASDAVAAAAVGVAVAPAAPQAAEARPLREPLWSLLPPIALGLVVLLLGLYLPAPLSRLIGQAAAQLGVGP